MNVEDTKEILQLAEVDPAYYIFDEERHEALCLVRTGGSWEVFISERGDRYEARVFASEDAACTFLLKRILQLWQPR